MQDYLMGFVLGVWTIFIGIGLWYHFSPFNGWGVAFAIVALFTLCIAVSATDLDL